MLDHYNAFCSCLKFSVCVDEVENLLRISFAENFSSNCFPVVSSLPVIVVDGSKSFSFPGFSLIRIVSSTTSGFVSLVRGFTHDKSAPFLFSTPQARSHQQQTEILIHLLKILTQVNDISGVMSTLWGYFLHEYGKNFSFRVAAHASEKYQSNSTSGRGARASYQTMLPEISARRSLLEPSFGYLSPGREGEKCRPLDHMWQIPFVDSARLIMGSNSYLYNSILVFSSMWYVQVCLAVFTITIAHALLQKHSCLWFRDIISLVFFHMIRAGAYWHKVHDHACTFAVNTKWSVISFGFLFRRLLWRPST